MDEDLWLLDPIAVPAATDRLGLATGPGAGGRSVRGDFAWRHPNGYLFARALDYAAPGPTAGVIDNKTSLYLTNGFSDDYGLNMGVAGNGFAYLQAQRRDGSGALYPILLNPLGGAVGIGTSAPQQAIHLLGIDPVLRVQNSSSTANPYGFELVGGGLVDGSFKSLLTTGEVRITAGRHLTWGGHLTFYTDTVERMRITPTGVVRASSDNSQPLGAASYRWSVVYAGTGAINTCDVRFKTFRVGRDLTAAEQAAALELFDAFGFYQFNDAIEAKGPDGARWHYGPAAQQAWSIWASHGLCDPLIENDKGELVPPPGAVPPAFLCFDLIAQETAPVTEGWRPSEVLGPDGQPVMVKCAEGEEATEQRPTGETIVTREAGHLFGVRMDQMQSIMLAALNKERRAQAAVIADLAARVALLEGAA